MPKFVITGRQHVFTRFVLQAVDVTLYPLIFQQRYSLINMHTAVHTIYNITKGNELQNHPSMLLINIHLLFLLSTSKSQIKKKKSFS